MLAVDVKMLIRYIFTPVMLGVVAVLTGVVVSSGAIPERSGYNFYLVIFLVYSLVYVTLGFFVFRGVIRRLWVGSHGV